MILNAFLVSRCKLFCTGYPINPLCHSNLAARRFPGLGVSTAAETLICLCRPSWLEQAMRIFSLPIWLKCGQRPLENLGVFTVFGWLAASRRPKAGETPRRQAVRCGSMGWPVRWTPNHTSTAPTLPPTTPEQPQLHASLAANSLIHNAFLVSRCKFYCTGNHLNRLCHSHLPARRESGFPVNLAKTGMPKAVFSRQICGELRERALLDLPRKTARPRLAHNSVKCKWLNDSQLCKSSPSKRRRRFALFADL